MNRLAVFLHVRRDEYARMVVWKAIGEWQGNDSSCDAGWDWAGRCCNWLMIKDDGLGE